jgi:hypothetical protein
MQTTVQRFATWWSIWLIAIFIVAVLIWPAMLGDPTPMRHIVVAGTVLMVNFWHALFHLCTGIVGLFAAVRRRTAQTFAIAAGTFYVGIGIVAFSGSDILGPFGMMPNDIVGNAAHVLEGSLMLVVGLGSLRTSRRRA